MRESPVAVLFDSTGVEKGTGGNPLVVTGSVISSGGLTDAQLRASPLALPTGAATEASLGTDGAAPPSIAGTGIRGWLRAIYDRLVAGITVSAASLPLPSGAATETTLALIKAKTDNLDVALSTRAVTGLTDTQLRATALPVSAASLPLPSGAATSAKQDTMIAGLATLNSLVPSSYDYVSLAYTGDNLTTVVFKSGGVSGTTVSTLTLAYNGSVLSSVTRS